VNQTSLSQADRHHIECWLQTIKSVGASSYRLIPTKNKSMKRFFIGIDFSKLKFDAVLFDGKTTTVLDMKEFKNQESGFKAMTKWIKSMTTSDSSRWLFCGEHTGLYCIAFGKYMVQKKYDFWLEPGLRIKYSQGMTRGKSDKIEAIQIADYAYRHRDKAVYHQGLNPLLEQLKDLIAYRNRLIDNKKSLEVSCNELIRVKVDNTTAEYIYQDSQKMIQSLISSIKTVEAKIQEILYQEACLKENYDLLISIKGIGMINAVLVLVFTGNFTLFSDARKFGCYCGVVPFEHSSGTSVKGRDKISHLANKSVKTSLTQAARTAVMHDASLKAYYQRKKLEGKPDRLIINNVRNKLIHRMFAVVKTRRKYENNYQHPLQFAA